MASTMIDLTEDSSDVGCPTENASGLDPKNYVSIATMNRYTRSPLKPITNSAREPTKQSLVSAPLKAAIDSVESTRLRKLITSFCESNAQLREQFEGEFLVRGREVVRYHPDTESEDAGLDSEEDGDEYDDREKVKKELNQKRSLALGDEEMTPRFVKCENCDEEFDVTVNERGNCVWHEGEKEYYDDDDFWADHDPDCHGDPDNLIDDSDYAEGFMWNCCNKLGNEEGCKQTKHRAEVNLISKDAPPAPVIAPVTTRVLTPPQLSNLLNPANKRKAEEELERPVYARCKNCDERYEINLNGSPDEIECTYHPGKKVLNEDADCWYDHDEDVNGPYEDYIDDFNYAEGFMWDCCDDIAVPGGCTTVKYHVALK